MGPGRSGLAQPPGASSSVSLIQGGNRLVQLLCKPLHRGGCALLLQQGLFGLSLGLVGKFQSCCPFVPTRTMTGGSEHRSNRAPSVSDLRLKHCCSLSKGWSPEGRCLPEPGLSVSPYKGSIDLCRPDPRLVQSSETPGAPGELGLAMPMGMCRAFLPSLCVCLSPLQGASGSG